MWSTHSVCLSQMGFCSSYFSKCTRKNACNIPSLWSCSEYERLPVFLSLPCRGESWNNRCFAISGMKRQWVILLTDQFDHEHTRMMLMLETLWELLCEYSRKWIRSSWELSNVVLKVRFVAERKEASHDHGLGPAFSPPNLSFHNAVIVVQTGKCLLCCAVGAKTVATLYAIIPFIYSRICDTKSLNHYIKIKANPTYIEAFCAHTVLESCSDPVYIVHLVGSVVIS